MMLFIGLVLMFQV